MAAPTAQAPSSLAGRAAILTINGYLRGGHRPKTPCSTGGRTPLEANYRCLKGGYGSEAVANAEPPVRIAGPLRRGAGRITVEHGSGAPAGQLH